MSLNQEKKKKKKVLEVVVQPEPDISANDSYGYQLII